MRAEIAVLVATCLLVLAGCLPEMDRVLDHDSGLAPVSHSSESSLRFPDGSVQVPDVSLQTPDADPDTKKALPADTGTLPSDTKPPQQDAKTAPPDTLAPDAGIQPRWYQADSAHCPTYCQSIGMANVAGPDGAHCMSGEVRSGSGISQGIQFIYGCAPTCSPLGPHTATSLGAYCYMPAQSVDNDNTDRTVACFCAPKR